MVDADDNRFIRIGKSLIVNRGFYILMIINKNRPKCDNK